MVTIASASRWNEPALAEEWLASGVAFGRVVIDSFIQWLAAGMCIIRPGSGRRVRAPASSVWDGGRFAFPATPNSE
ncbi:hypothetical protein NITHO_160022 [Nitrolancea hollandica Lb]|uniref:Uncharacterized protein n=1 Tax=Nitrolancea hollandica Lb TaxID=1129897 RepID=I4EDV3_9BACT|nr:hypothetical protein NITHO_160022 [Nitrolancea hollandica Lb]